MNRALVIVLSIALANACASGTKTPASFPPAPERNIPASAETVVTDVDRTSQEQTIYVKNGSSVPITVTGIEMTNCINIVRCGVIPLQVRVAPGRKVQVFVVRPKDTELTFFYKYTWAWEPAPQ